VSVSFVPKSIFFFNAFFSLLWKFSILPAKFGGGRVVVKHELYWPSPWDCWHHGFFLIFFNKKSSAWFVVVVAVLCSRYMYCCCSTFRKFYTFLCLQSQVGVSKQHGRILRTPVWAHVVSMRNIQGIWLLEFYWIASGLPPVWLETGCFLKELEALACLPANQF